MGGPGSPSASFKIIRDLCRELTRLQPGGTMRPCVSAFPDCTKHLPPFQQKKCPSIKEIWEATCVLSRRNCLLQSSYPLPFCPLLTFPGEGLEVGGSPSHPAGWVLPAQLQGSPGAWSAPSFPRLWSQVPGTPASLHVCGLEL